MAEDGRSESTDTDGDNPITVNQFHTLMAAINATKSSVEDQMRGLKRELQESQEKVSEDVVKKVRRCKRPEFKKKGNEVQFVFNEQVAEKLETVDEDLEKIAVATAPSAKEAAVKKAKEA